MADSPYLITGPALISFSGGRSSAYMLKKMIDAHGGRLPDDIHVCFANTGRELEPTLRFVHDCATNWDVRVHWLEFVSNRQLKPPAERFCEVGFNSASRNGEPFDRLISLKGALPTGRQRWCTEFMKVRVLFDYAEAAGLGKPGEFKEIIGLRADEKARIIRLQGDARNEARQIICPMSTAGVVKSDIFSFWKASSFDLKLERGFGNCDQCPFIGKKARIARAQARPASCEWWAGKEIETGYRFGRDLTMIEVLGIAASSPTLPIDDDYDSECGTWCPSMVTG